MQQSSSSNRLLLSSLKIAVRIFFFLLLSFHFMYLRHGSMINKNRSFPDLQRALGRSRYNSVLEQDLYYGSFP